jgi:hypothetical protein
VREAVAIAAHVGLGLRRVEVAIDVEQAKPVAGPVADDVRRRAARLAAE